MNTTIRDHILRCPICGQRFKHRTQHAGQTIRCQQCKGRILSVGESLVYSHRIEQFNPTQHPQPPRRQAILWHDQADQPRPAVLLLESRDEVFARLAMDLAETGMTVIRAMTVCDALKACSQRRFDLVIANTDSSDSGGWRLAECLPEGQSPACLWLYQSRTTAIDASRAKTLEVAELIPYHGDLLGLADMILDCFAGMPPKPTRANLVRRSNRSLSAAA